MKKKAIFDFGTMKFEAEIFDTSVGRELFENLPVSIDLITWGDEAYGPIYKDLGEEKLQNEIPPGGIAYTRQGDYLCIFYGQKPAWAVEYVGHIEGDWRQLLQVDMTKVTIRKVEE